MSILPLSSIPSSVSVVEEQEQQNEKMKISMEELIPLEGLLVLIWVQNS